MFKNSVFKKLWLASITLVVLLQSNFAFAGASSGGSSGGNNVAGVADNLIGNFDDLAKFIVAAAFIMGLGFAVASILKFHAHKNNPQQIPIGTPIALLFIAAALIFIPNIFTIAGTTLFGANAKAGSSQGQVPFASSSGS